jgi:hypothetical protein
MNDENYFILPLQAVAQLHRSSAAIAPDHRNK